MSDRARFVLITPAHNEAGVIGLTLDAVLAQSVRPDRWIIVDDGSSDATADIVRRRIAGEDWIRLVRREPGAANFASKVHAFAAGLAEVDGVDYDVIGNLDADVTVPPGYFERLLGELAGRPRLGLVGGHVVEVVGRRRTPQRISPNSVAGAVQLFRRRTFEDIGGLRPMRLGGEDSAAEILARMHGWEVATLFDVPVDHHGPILGGARGPVRTWYVKGKVFHHLGYDPLFQVAVGLYRAAAQRPYVISGAAMLTGYSAAMLRRTPRALATNEVAFLRAEQRGRLRRLWRRGSGA